MLQKAGEEDLAKRRCVMILDVLSGRTPVTDAIERAQISRGTYYQLETKALRGMLEALEPETRRGPSPDATKALEQLQQKVEKLEAENRRLDRLLSLTTRILKPGSVTTGSGRKKSKKRKASKPSSGNSSRTTRSRAEASRSTPAGEVGR
jgi:hypothetical protein